jgi:transcription termination factor NusB
LNYVTFDQFAEKHKINEELVKKIRDAPLQKLASLLIEENVRSVKKKIEEEGKPEDELEDEDRISFILYWHKIMRNKKEKPEKICKWVKKRCSLRLGKVEDEKLIRIMLAQSFHEIYYGLQSQKLIKPEEVTPLLVNKNLPDKLTSIDLTVPIVPIISIFSTYIVALVNEIIKLYHKSELTIEYFWNVVTYEKIKEDFLNRHLAYDKEIKFVNISHISERRFRSFANLLLLSSSWKDLGEESASFEKMKILRKIDVIDGTKLEKDMDQRIYTNMIARRMRRLHSHDKLVIGGLKDYMGNAKEQERDLISLYAEEIIRRKKKPEESIFLIGRLPDLVLLEDILEEKEKENVYLIAYLPFPFEQQIRVTWPFFVTWYSPYAYGAGARNNDSDDIYMVLRKEYIRKLIISVLKMLRLNFLNTTKLDGYEVREILDFVTNDVFKKIDEEIDQQLQYIF